MLKVSVLLPVWNGEATLQRALDSLWQQSLQDFEVVVVDDGSTDRTKEILAGCNDSRLNIISQSHAGIARALNNGLQHCKAPLIARMDADDFAHVERLEDQYAYLQQHPEVAVLSCRVAFGGEPEESRGYYLYVQAINELLTHTQMWKRRFWDAPLAHPSVMFRKEAVLMAGGYNEGAVPEDYELWLRLFELGYRFAKLPQTLLNWHDHPDRLSRTHLNYDKKAFWQLKANYFSRWLQQKHGCQHPPVYLWGETKKKSRSRYLEQFGVKVAGKISMSVDAQAPEIPYQQVPDLGDCIILVYVSDRRGRRQIIEFLRQAGFSEGEDFFLMV